MICFLMSCRMIMIMRRNIHFGYLHCVCIISTLKRAVVMEVEKNWRPCVIDTEGEKKNQAFILWDAAHLCSRLSDAEGRRDWFYLQPLRQQTRPQHTGIQEKRLVYFSVIFFILLSLKTQGHTHAHTNITSCRKQAMQKITIICVYICHHKSRFVCIMLWMSTLKIIFMHEQKKRLKNNGEKGGDRLCSVYHPWGEKCDVKKANLYLWHRQISSSWQVYSHYLAVTSCPRASAQRQNCSSQLSHGAY